MRRFAFALALAMSSATAMVVACSASNGSSIPNSGGDAENSDPDAASADPDVRAPDPDSSAPGTDSSAPGTDSSAPGPDSATAALKLTSTSFSEGGSIPDANSCNGANESPPLAWTAGPATTKSYAVVLKDTTDGLIHAVLYDIPANVKALPPNLQTGYALTMPVGAHWTTNYKGAYRYVGPCPQTEHVYEFALYALDVATLPGATMTTTRTQALAIILMHDVASTKLTAKYKP